MSTTSIPRVAFATKLVFRLLQILLAVAVVVILSVYVEEIASRGLRYPPVFMWDFVTRALACFVGSTAGYFISKRHSYAVLGSVVAFYLWYDWSRLIRFVGIDWHPTEWYPFTFPSYQVVWLITAIPPTILGLALGRYVAAVLATRLEWREAQQGSN